MNIAGVAESSGTCLSFAHQTASDDREVPSEIVTGVAVGCFKVAGYGRLADCRGDLLMIGNMNMKGHEGTSNLTVGRWPSALLPHALVVKGQRFHYQLLLLLNAGKATNATAAS